MAWEDQGRQEHGWFGNGTSGNEPLKATRDLAMKIGVSALAQLPASQRQVFGSWLHGRGLNQLQTVLPAWTAGARLSPGAFQDAFFGPYSSGAEAAQQVGVHLAGADAHGDHDAAWKAAGRSFAEFVKDVRPEVMNRIMLIAAQHADMHDSSRESL